MKMNDVLDILGRLLPVIEDVPAQMWTRWTVHGKLTLFCPARSSRIVPSACTLKGYKVTP